VKRESLVPVEWTLTVVITIALFTSGVAKGQGAPTGVNPSCPSNDYATVNWSAVSGDNYYSLFEDGNDTCPAQLAMTSSNSRRLLGRIVSWLTDWARYLVLDVRLDDVPRHAQTGPTRNYGYGSPVNGTALSSYPLTSDIYNGAYGGADEDGVASDCYLWNATGHASTGNMNSSPTITYLPSAAQVEFSGLAQNPLEPSVGTKPAIAWDMIVEVDDFNPSTPTSYVTYNHTCYPAHIVTVNGTVVYSYLPPKNNTPYLAGCLFKLIPEVSGTTSSVQVPNQ
jgi:hypothetical protein